MDAITGQITDIQRFSLNDGFGIRTTVFFKGCNMKCTWCHNPETISAKQQVHLYASKCIGCGKCFEVCPKGVHYVEEGVHRLDRTKCVGCGACADACYAEALSMSGKTMSVSEVMREIVQDIPYYKESGGGVTLSGGEVLCQREFALGIIEACKEQGIHTAVETNLNFKFDAIAPVLKSVDLIMCDMKIFDDDKHKEYTGVSNTNILENIKKADELGVPMIVRTPLIPGATDDDTNIIEIAGFLKSLKNLVRYEVLNFNPLGAAKYQSLDMENPFEAAKPFKEERLSQIGSMLDEIGISYKII